MDARNSSPAPVLVAGEFSKASGSLVEQALSEASIPSETIASATEAVEWMRQQRPTAVLIDAHAEASRTAAIEMRAEQRNGSVPIIGVSPELDDLMFAEMFSWGGDDLVIDEATWQLVNRLRWLGREPVGSPPREAQGKALIGDTERVRRAAIARTLHAAGYDASFMLDEDRLLDRARDEDPEVIVTSLSVSPDPEASIRACRDAGVQAMWVVLCPPREIAAHRARAEQLPSVAVTDGFAPPENVLFLVNELRHPVANSRRASRRLLYGTTVLFRGAGREDDDRGYSFNVSEGGLYVRTLAPPTDEHVWLELMPPRSERRVRLVGKVAWARHFGPNQRATVPPGFGVQIVDGAESDRAAWKDGYAAFRSALG